jgi:hypothetical protein
MKANQIKAFFLGFGSFLDIWPHNPPRFKLGSLEDDAKALQSDWDAIFGDIKKASDKQISQTDKRKICTQIGLK